jgi:hypothetical protein
MHGMFKRAAASAIPALVGLAIYPATAMAAPHTSRAVAGPVKGDRQTHERLAQLRLSDARRGRLAATARTAKTTADTYGPDSTFTAIPVYPYDGNPWLARFHRGPGTVKGGTAIGVIISGKYDKVIGNHVYANAGSGIDKSTGGTVGNGIAGTAGNSLNGHVAAAVPPQ